MLCPLPVSVAAVSDLSVMTKSEPARAGGAALVGLATVLRATQRQPARQAASQVPRAPPIYPV